MDSLYGKPVRVFDSKDVPDMLARAGLDIVAQYGVRVFSDYLRGQTSETTYQQLLELELIPGALPSFAAIARYTQVIARRSSAQWRKGSER